MALPRQGWWGGVTGRSLTLPPLGEVSRRRLLGPLFARGVRGPETMRTVPETVLHH